MHLSIVTTLYRSAPHLVEFHERIMRAAQAVSSDYELIMVNDGSPDDSQRVAMEICERDPRSSLIELSRNFGHHKAIMTGLARARGEWVLLIDCDLEEEPELLVPFYQAAQQPGLDVVYGVQSRRKGAWFEAVTGAVFYRLINLLSTTPVPKNLVTLRIMRRAYVASLVEHRDQELFLAGLWALTGYRQVAKEINKLSRSPTTYTIRRKVWNLVNAITSFSTKPLVFIFLMGCVISVCAAFAGTYLVIRRLFFGTLLEGWASLMASIWFLGGLSILSLGVIGIYLSKIFIETKPRPYTIVRSIHGLLGQAPAAEVTQAVVGAQDGARPTDDAHNGAREATR
jgi:putative glycosyltransferase